MPIWAIRAIFVVSLVGLLPAYPGDTVRPTRLDLNTATEQQLVELPHIGAAFARAIVEMRSRNGDFRCVEELRAVPRLPAKHFAELALLLKVEGGRADCAALEQRRREGKPLTAASSL